jgi:hypothetical protein
VERKFTPSSAMLFGRMVKLAGIAVLAAISPLIFAGSHFGSTLVTELIALAVVGLGLVAYARLSLRNTRVDAAPGRLRIQNFLGAAHEVAAHHLADVVFVRTLVPAKGENQSATGARLFVLDDTGRSVLRWSENSWTPRQMRELAESLQLPTDSIEEPISRLQLIERYPRALRFTERRPVLFVVILLSSLILALAVIVAVATTASS